MLLGREHASASRMNRPASPLAAHYSRAAAPPAIARLNFVHWQEPIMQLGQAQTSDAAVTSWSPPWH